MDKFVVTKMLMEKGFSIKPISATQFEVNNGNKTAWLNLTTGIYKIEGETKFKNGIYNLISDLEN